MSDTVNDLMGSIPGIPEDDASDATQETSSTDTGSNVGGEAAAQTDPTSKDTGTQQAGAADTGTPGQKDGAATKVQAAPTQAEGRVVKLANGLEIRPDPANPKATQLVDPRTGQVVANNAMEVRTYGKLQAENQAYQQELATLRAANQAYEQANSYAREAGLVPEQQLTAVRLMGDFLKDPVGTLGKIVAEMQANGHELPFMQQAGVSPAAMQQMLDARLQPLLAPQQQAAQQAEVEKQAQVALDNFLATHQNASQNLPFLGYILEKGAATSYEAAYTTMLEWCAEHKFDPRIPLEPQIEARKAQPTGATPEPTTAVRQMPLPNGRTALDVGEQQSTEQAAANGLYSETMSWEDIVRDGMRSAGMKV